VRPNELVLRCYAERKGDHWVALCIDFDLAAQAEHGEDTLVAIASPDRSSS
jgi:hypothetical protein